MGDDSGERLLCRCSSVGTSMNSDSSAGSDGLWNMRISSSRRLSADCLEVDAASLLLLFAKNLSKHK